MADQRITTDHAKTPSTKTKKTPRKKKPVDPMEYNPSNVTSHTGFLPPGAPTQQHAYAPPRPPQPYYPRPYVEADYTSYPASQYPYAYAYAPVTVASVPPPTSQIPVPVTSSWQQPVATIDRSLSKPSEGYGAAQKPNYRSSGPVVLREDRLNNFTELIHPTTVVDPYNPRDVTLHMSLDSAPDVEGFLEASARLRRLGRFKSAIAHFQLYLAHASENLYVLTQFAQCLLDARDFDQLAQLAKRHEVEYRTDEIAVNWEFLLRVAAKLSGTHLWALDSRRRRHHSRGTPPSDYIEDAGDMPDSTQMQNLALAVHLCSSSFVPYRNWSKIYQHLLADERVWELKDLLLALEEQEGLEDAASMLLHDRYSDWDSDILVTIKRLAKDWGSLTVDESCYFGGLELFASLSIACSKLDPTKKRTAMEVCLGAAGKYAEHLSHADVENMKSRPFLMWMMAKSYLDVALDEKTDADFIIFNGSERGTFHQTTPNFPYEELPIYAPKEEETPKWKPKKLFMTDVLKRTTEVVLNAAEELGDVPLQVGCLQQLAVHGTTDPREYVDRILKLWKAAGNRQSYLRVLLFRYLLLRDDTEKEALRSEILEHGECSETDFTEYCRRMILRSLTPHEFEKTQYLERAKAMELVSDDSDVSSLSTWNSDSDASGHRRRTRFSGRRRRLGGRRHARALSSDDEGPSIRVSLKDTKLQRESRQNRDTLEVQRARKPVISKDKTTSIPGTTKIVPPATGDASAIGDDLITYPDTVQDSSLAAHVEDKSDDDSG